MGLFGDLKEDLVGLVRDPTDEQKAILVAIAAIFAADRYFLWIDFPFIVRTTAAVGVGFVAMFVVSYLLTGRLVPPTRATRSRTKTSFIRRRRVPNGLYPRLRKPDVCRESRSRFENSKRGATS
jgi:hypothetical protein